MTYVINHLEYLLLAGICLFFGILFACFSYISARNIRKQTTWPCVKGTVMESGYRFGIDFVYNLSLVYIYVVDNVSYTGTKEQYFNSFNGNVLDAEKHAAQYRKGAVVDVYYNPDMPASSVLKPEAGLNSIWFFYVISGVFALIGIIIIVVNCMR